MDLSFRYQHRLTRWVGRFDRLATNQLFVAIELRLLNVIAHTRLFPTDGGIRSALAGG